MRKVELNMKEEIKYNTIKELVEHHGNKRRASVKLDISIRQIDRLILLYKKRGKEGFIHGNRSKEPVNKLSYSLSTIIIQLYDTKYKSEKLKTFFNFKHFQEMLKSEENIVVSYTTLRTILMKAGYLSPRAHKLTKKKNAMERKRKETEVKKEKISEEEMENQVNHEIALEDAHPRKERPKFFGEKIEMDACSMVWFGNKKLHLHLAIDASRGVIVGGWFDYQETLDGYYHVTKQMLLKYGIPYRIITDKRTVFAYQNCKMKEDIKDVLTQYGYFCKTSGIILEVSSIPQHKPRVERTNGSVQDRLSNELRLRKIDNIDDANKYLLDVFIPNYNKQFSLKYGDADSVFIPSPSESEINKLLSVISIRKFDTGSAISYHNKYYQPYLEGQKICFAKGTKCLVIKMFDGQYVLSVDDKIYDMVEINKFELNSPDFDNVEDNNKPAKKIKAPAPAANHPWRLSYFRNYIESNNV